MSKKPPKSSPGGTPPPNYPISKKPPKSSPDGTPPPNYPKPPPASSPLLNPPSESVQQGVNVLQEQIMETEKRSMQTRSEMKSILYVTSTTKIGGAETALKRTLKHIDKKCYRTGVLITGEKGALDSEYKTYTQEMSYLEEGSLEEVLIEKIIKGKYDCLHFFNCFEIYELLPKLKKIQPNLRIISSIMITPRVFTTTSMKKTYKIIQRNEKHLYALIVDSKGAKELFPNAVIIKNGVDTSKFKPVKKNPKLVVWIGRLSREKGTPVMLDIARAMPNYKFVLIVGTKFKYPNGWKPYQDWIDNAIKNKPSNLEIKIGLSEDKVANWMSKASFFISTSLSESLPISIIEAMASGCAVLSTNVGDAPKIIEHEINGFIIHHTDITKWHKIKDKTWLKDGVEIPRTARTLLQYHVSPKSKMLDEEIKRYVVKTILKINVTKIGKKARESVKHLTIDNQVKRYEFIYGNIGSHQGQTRIAFVWAYPDIAPKFWEQKIDSMQHAISALSNEYCVILYAPKPKEESHEFSIINGCNIVFYPFENSNSLIPLMKEFKPHLICLNSLHFPIHTSIVNAFPDTYKTIYEYGGNLRYPLLKKIDILFVQQKFRIKEAVKQAQIPESKVMLNPYCVDTDLFKPTKTEKKYNAVMVADFRRNIKRQDILIKAWKDVPGKLLLVARLNQPSPYGDYERHCRQIIQMLGLENRVFIQDFVPNDQLPAILNQCKIGVMTSKREGGSRAMLEVMSCGLPMIVLDDSKGCIDMIRSGIDGLVSSSNKLGDTINNLLENPIKLEKMGKAAATRIKKEYPYNRQLSVFQKIISKDKLEISVLTTSYHRGDYIEDCLRAVEKQRLLSGHKINHIVVDAGSTDGTLKILKKHENKIDYYIKKGMPQLSSLNFMMDIVNTKYPNTDYIGWINADDWYEDNFLAESLKHMKNFDATTSQYFVRYNHNKTKKGVSDPGREYLDEVAITDFLSGNRIAQNTILIKKPSFDALRKKTGFYFNPDFEYTMDYELWIRLLRNGFRITRIRRPLSNLRVHDFQMSRVEKSQVMKDFLKVQTLLKEWGIKK